MNRFKILSRLILAIGFVASLVTVTQAQGRLHTTQNIIEGQFVDLGGLPGHPTDSLGVSDTTVYTIPITHTHEVWPYFSWEWVKSGSGTATVTLTFQQSMDNINYYNVLKGQAQSTYSKSYTLSASGTNEVEFCRDTAIVGGRYLKLTFITSATASVKGTLHGRIKANIQ